MREGRQAGGGSERETEKQTQRKERQRLKARRTTAGRENVSVVVKALKNNGVLHEAKIYSRYPAVLSPSGIPGVGQGFTWSHIERRGSPPEIKSDL